MSSLQPIELTADWIEGIRSIAPAQPTVPVERRRRALMISVSTGYMHWVTPHTGAMIKVLAEKSGAFEVVETEDPERFAPESLSGYDSVIFNNTCPIDPGRDLFYDILQDEARAAELRDSVLAFVANGGGLVSIHGGIIAFNNHLEWSEMQGGSFARHPPQQEITITAVDPDHRLVQAFGGEPLVHVDEPYFYKNAYAKKRFRPLLVMDTSTIGMGQGRSAPSDECYVAWVKRYGEGRVFYCSPSHNAQSFQDPRLLQFFLDGIQYAFGDLKCDDSPA
jgi:type 1 glutamine amidotransferase